jgi:hypothetical protein
VHIAKLSSPQLPLLHSHLAHSILLFCQIAKSWFTLWTFSNELQAAHTLNFFVGCSLHNFFSSPRSAKTSAPKNQTALEFLGGSLDFERAPPELPRAIK